MISIFHWCIKNVTLIMSMNGNKLLIQNFRVLFSFLVVSILLYVTLQFSCNETNLYKSSMGSYFSKKLESKSKSSSQYEV